MSTFEFQMPKHQSSIIKVIGVGGGGGNAVNNMYIKGIKGVDFIVCNTDLQALETSPVPNKIRLGTYQTEGLGAGANPEVGRLAAMESIEEIREILKQNTKMVFITAGMGGGTGTGAAPVIAALAKEMGILTVAIVTSPFRFEGKKRMMQAQEGVRGLEKAVDTILTINNDNLTHIFGNNVTMKRAFEEADQVLCEAAKGIAEIITREGYINVDFADVQTIMRDGGTALMGTATYSGEDRAIRAAEDAISSPLLDNVNIHGSRGILVNITAAADSLRLDETTTIVEYIQEAAGDNADIIFGTVYDDSLGDKLSVTVIATGFGKAPYSAETHAQQQPVQQRFTTPPVTPPVVQQQQPPVTPPQPEVPKTPDFSLEDFTLSSFTIEPVEPNAQPSLFGSFSIEPEQPKQEAQEKKMRHNEETLEERIKKLRSSEFDFHNPAKLDDMEKTPAYLRKNLDLEQQQSGQPQKLSRLSLEEVDENRFQLSNNNSFLHDNVD